MSEQSEYEGKKQSDELGFERLVFFSDAVMAIAITLMALEIHVEELEPELVSEQIGPALRALAPRIFVYMLSFLVVGIYWVVHHRLFRLVRRYDIPLLWLNLIFLMSVAFLPVATNALGTYPSVELVTAFYAISVALLGLTEFALWFYAVRKGYTVELSERHSHKYFGARILVPPLVFLFSLLLFPIGARFMQVSWLAIIPILYLLRFVFPREHAERSDYARGET